MIPVQLIAGAGISLLMFGAGWKVCDWKNDSRNLAIQQAAQKAGEAATIAAVDAIKSNRPIYQTINKTLEKELRSEIRYTSPDCSHTPESWRMLDQAYQAAGGQPFDSGAVVPAAPAATGRDTGRDNPGPR